MGNEKCTECKKTLGLEEENLCTYCNLNRGRINDITLNVNCGICEVIVKEDSEGLFCDVCNSWFHNRCNKTPLNYNLYALLDEAPNNVKWFCDKCIWETDKWIKSVSNELNMNENANKNKNEAENMLINEECNREVNGDGNEIMHERYKEELLEEDNEDHCPGLPETDIEVFENNELENEERYKSLDTDEWDKEDRKIKHKNKCKLSPSGIIGTVSETIKTEHILSILDISPERLLSITDGIIYVKRSNSKRIRAKCNLCPKDFMHPEGCIAHKLRDHEGVRKPYKCSVIKCVFKAMYKNKLKCHMETHSNEKTFTCHICGKSLRRKGSLQYHLKNVHYDEKIDRHNCLKCDFTTKNETV